MSSQATERELRELADDLGLDLGLQVVLREAVGRRARACPVTSGGDEVVVGKWIAAYGPLDVWVSLTSA